MQQKYGKIMCQKPARTSSNLGRNFYKGVFGDVINIMLDGAAFNFKRAMRLLLHLFFRMDLKNQRL